MYSRYICSISLHCFIVARVLIFLTLRLDIYCFLTGLCLLYVVHVYCFDLGGGGGEGGGGGGGGGEDGEVDSCVPDH